MFRSLRLASVAFPLFVSSPSLAQSITAAPDSTGTVITIEGNTYQIEGGTQAGTNLFHSFQTLGLNSGAIANFLSNPSISNIFGRVTGGEASVIDGLLQVTGANSNLYLMNPAGMVFGSGASLNIGGDFVATTSDRVHFAQGWFNASGTNDYANLTGEPNQFAFLSENPGAILNFGDLSTTQNISLIGGTVLNQGQIISSQGNVTIAAVPGERLVNISQPGMLLSLEVPQDAIAPDITPVDFSILLTGSGLDGNAIAPGDVAIAGEVSGQQVDLYAAGKVTPTDAALIQGDTRVIRFSTTGENPDQAVFIDRRADNPENLLFGAAAGTVAQIIERDEHGINVVTEQLTEISEAVGELESIAIVAEGNQGNFWLGNQWIRGDNVNDYGAQLQTWGEALTTNADILLYSCFTALGATGEALVQSIADLTGTDVAASVDATGSVNFGADWQLETSSGAIEALNPFTPQTLSHWQGKLNTLTVTDFSDAGTGDTLRNQIASAAIGDTVMFASAATVTLNGTEISWSTDNLTIDGNGGTVDGAGASRIFNIAANNTTIQNLTIQNGSTTGVGGGIHTAGAIALTNSTVSGNSSGDQGGGIRTNGGAVTLTNSTVSGNSSGTNGGGIRTNGGAVTLTNSTVSGNSVTTNGGGIFTASGTVTLNNSMVLGNTAGSDGGGIRTNVGNVTLTNSTLGNNSSGAKGGGIFTESGTVTLTNSTISSNSALSNGGGIRTDGGDVTLNNSTLNNNFATSNGGGIATGSGTIALTDSTLSNNQASLSGDGAFIGSNGRFEAVHNGDLELIDTIATQDATAAITLSGRNLRLSVPLQSNGSDIEINAQQGVDALTANATISSVGANAGGNITITAGGNLNLRNVISAGLNGNGGNITLTTTGGAIATTTGGSAGLVNTSGLNGNGGNVTLEAAQGITLGTLFAEGVGGTGGTVRLASDRLIRLTGINTGNLGTTNTSLSTAGSTAGGPIAIRHGGQGLIPFTVGNANTNGTAGSLSTGNSAAQTLAPTQVFFGNVQQGSIQILTDTGSNISEKTLLPSPPTTLPIFQFDAQASLENFISTIAQQLNANYFIDPKTGEIAIAIRGENNALIWQTSDDAAPTNPSTVLDLGDLEQQLTAAYGKDLDGELMTFTQIQTTLRQIEQQTGTRSALIYAVSQPDALDLILITAGQDEPLYQRLPAADRQTLQKTIRRFRRSVNRVSSSNRAPAQQLYDWLIRPIESNIADLNIDTLVFAMGDGLRAIPLAALHNGEQFLIEKYSLGQIPSLSLTDSRYVPLQDANVLAMGASEFESLPPLPAVPSELALVADLKAGEQYLNSTFTQANLKTQSRDRNFEIIHLATHAAFQAGAADNSYIQLWGDEQMGINELRELRWFEDPKVELLVLSACETALGDPYAELGFAGLAVQAGVKTTLASLWQVSDLGTMRLMQEFYTQLNNPTVTIKAEALRQAQLALLRGEATAGNGLPVGMTLPLELAPYADTDLSHPFYWSGFTLVGSPW